MSDNAFHLRKWKTCSDPRDAAARRRCAHRRVSPAHTAAAAARPAWAPAHRPRTGRPARSSSAAGSPREPCDAALARAPLTPVHTEVTVIFVQGFQCGDIGSSWSNLIHPLDGLHHFVPLLLCKDRGALVLGNLLWARNRKTQLKTRTAVTKTLSYSSLTHSTGT